MGRAGRLSNFLTSAMQGRAAHAGRGRDVQMRQGSKGRERVLRAPVPSNVVTLMPSSTSVVLASSICGQRPTHMGHVAACSAVNASWGQEDPHGPCGGQCTQLWGEGQGLDVLARQRLLSMVEGSCHLPIGA